MKTKSKMKQTQLQQNHKILNMRHVTSCLSDELPVIAANREIFQNLLGLLQPLRN